MLGNNRDQWSDITQRFSRETRDARTKKKKMSNTSSVWSQAKSFVCWLPCPAEGDPLVSQRSLILCRLMRKTPYFSVDLLSQGTVSWWSDCLDLLSQILFNTTWHSFCKWRSHSECVPSVWKLSKSHESSSLNEQAHEDYRHASNSKLQQAKTWLCPCVDVWKSTCAVFSMKTCCSSICFYHWLPNGNSLNSFGCCSSFETSVCCCNISLLQLPPSQPPLKSDGLSADLRWNFQ